MIRIARIAGAAIDVFDIEPLPADHSFRSLDNVLATPHIGYVAQELSPEASCSSTRASRRSDSRKWVRMPR
jgi:phosphoglycerate dehydrogenase-like enzyme